MTKDEILFLKSLVSSVTTPVSDYNLKAVFKLASKHNILPLCFENLSCAPDFDREKYQLFKQKIFSIVVSQMKRTANFKKIYQKLLAEGVKPLVLKGIVCRNLYGEYADHRPSGDEDILIEKNDYFKVQDVLVKNGYKCSELVTKKSLSGVQEITFKNDNGLNIEVHLNIIGTENKLRLKMNDFFEGVFEKAIELEIDGQKYYTLSYTEHYIYLIYHMFKHFSTTGVGVRQILDILKFNLAYADKIDFEKVYLAVEAINAELFYGDIIEIGNRFMGFNIHNKYGETCVCKLLDDMFSAGAYGNDSLEQMGSKVKVMSAIESNGKTNKLKMLFPSLKSMREFYKVLYNHPYLLPIMWLIRIIRYIFRLATGKTYNVSKSEQIADERIKLLKDYRIIR